MVLRAIARSLRLLPSKKGAARSCLPLDASAAHSGNLERRSPSATSVDSHLSTTLLDQQPVATQFAEKDTVLIHESEIQPPIHLHSLPESEPRLPSQPLSARNPTHQPLPPNSEVEHFQHTDDEQKIMQRKIWVKRPGASATLVSVNEEDVVDTVRDVILQKYANSLGRSIDSPDITLKICSREQGKNAPSERILGPEEPIGRTLDKYYVGGQTIDEALIVEVPQRRTPKPSPRPGNHHPNIAYPYYIEDHRPSEGARDYFPPMAVQSPHVSQHLPPQPNGLHSMAVLTTGQLPPLPSPGGHSTRKHGRPKYIRQHTSSPTILHSQQPNPLDIPQPHLNGVQPTSKPLPTPPAQSDHRPNQTPPNARTSSPHPGRSRRKKTQAQQPTKSVNGDHPPPKSASAALLDGNVPPINVLIVEDNVINLKLLEQMMRRLKVRFKSAMNGREAVNTWRTGGFHLVLMDIQLPVMNGLEATKEIRRLESVNGIGLGVFGGATSESKRNGSKTIEEEDRLTDRNLFKSPVIIVALTASSLQSDRHEALAAGCNDFLTKPVNYPWMERKVTEWGCMQALIDFDGWRKWKADAYKKDEGLTDEQRKAKDKEEKAKQKAALIAMFSRPPPSKKDDSSKETKKDDPSSSKSNTSNPISSTSSQIRNHKPTRSGSGNSGNAPAILETHLEVDEK